MMMVQVVKKKAFVDALKERIPTPMPNTICRKAYVELLDEYGFLYHFDDCAWDCLGGYNLSNYELDLINEYTEKLHSEELFQLALERI